MTQKKKQTPLNIRSVTAEQIRFLSAKSGLSMTQILADIVDAVFQVSCTYSALNLNYDFEISSSKVTVTCEGKNNLQSGELPVPQFAENKEADRILAKHLKKVKK